MKYLSMVRFRVVDASHPTTTAASGATAAKFSLTAEKSAELTTKATELFSTGAYATIEDAEQSAAAVLAAPNHFMNMFYAMGISMFVGALLIFLYFKFGKWHQKGIVHVEDT